MRKSLLLPLVVSLAVTFSNAFAQCRSAVRGTPDDVSVFYTGANYASDVNRNLRDYGIIFEDAGTDNCAAAAAVALYKKVSETLSNNGHWPVFDCQINQNVSAYGGWLEGVNVGLIHATALELGARGKLTAALHNLLMQISYPGNIDYHCGFDGDEHPGCPSDPGQGSYPRWSTGNSCMDDYAVAAHGWAWMGAYRKLSPTNSAWYEVTRARQDIKAALSEQSSICITPDRPDGDYYVGRNSRGPCTGTIADLSNGSIPAALHNGDAMPYGIGLMTSISSASAAMEVAGAPITLDSDEQTIAEALRTHGRDETEFNTAANNWLFKNGCIHFTWDANSPDNMHVAHDFSCAENYGEGGYKPGHVPVFDFYNRYVPNTNNAMYDFSQWDGSQFSDSNSFFMTGRKVVYKTLAQDWVWPWNRPALSGKLNQVSLRTVDGVHYVHAVGGGGSSVDAVSAGVGTDEQFGLIDLNGGTLNHGDLVQVQVNNGLWMVAEDGGGSVVNANRPEPDGWETFVIEKTDGTGGQITSGNTVALHSYWYGYYVVAEDGGGNAVNCNRTVRGPWETFTLTIY